MLWSLLHRSSIRPGATWEHLVGRFSMGDLVAAISRGRHDAPFTIVVWNVNWLKDLTSEQVRSKRNCIRRWLDQGRVVLLQETHWDDCDVGIWSNHLGGAHVAASAAVAGHGGVAIISPPACRC